MINGYVEKNLVNNKKSDALIKISKGSTMEEKINLAFLATLQRKQIPVNYVILKT